MKTVAFIIISVWISIQCLGQVGPQKYFIEFRDKNNSPYSVNRPGEFLTQRALDRRARQGIAISENDIPVNPSYITRLLHFNITFLTASKWFNGVTIYCANQATLDSIQQLPFVNKVVKSIDDNILNNYRSGNKFKSEEALHEVNVINTLPSNSGNSVNPMFNYGPSFRQIHMLGGDSLHKLGYRGEGMVIAVLDAGFYHVDLLGAFDSLRMNNQILGTKDFVKPGNNVYNEYEHGMEVLSCMGGNQPGAIIGTAPKAKYWLLRSEDYYSENIIEEYNWVSAAEFADSVGADIINSSLGYTQFDNPAMDHTCSDMNGFTTPATRGANFAFSKGMIVVNSAGNEGGTSWKCVSAPADANGVLAIAAVDSNGVHATFSSTGEATRRIKPNVAAMGQAAVVESTIGSIMHSSGTSFSSPILAGLTACLWQSAPSRSNATIVRAIELSGNRATHPDSLLGYGVPDFVKGLKHVGIYEKDNSATLQVFPNPFTDVFSARLTLKADQELSVTLLDQLGRIKCILPGLTARAGENRFYFNQFAALAAGCYFLRVTGGEFCETIMIVKLNP
ncbi:MAG: S8 family serine peptidase [Bacteroidota bacterium]